MTYNKHYLNAFDGGILRVGFFWDRLNVHTFNRHHRTDRRVQGWLRRDGHKGFEFARVGFEFARVGFEFARVGGYQYIYCLPPAGGRIRSQGNYYCLPPAGVLHSQNKVINAPPTASQS